MKKERYEHFERLVYESTRSLFYVSTEGKAYSVNKKTGEKYELKNVLHKNTIRVAIKGLNTPTLKRLVWQIAKGPIDKSWHVQCIDNDETNCNIENLKIVLRSQAARLTGPMSRSRVVIIKERNQEQQYSSVRKAAKALYVSYQTLLDYLASDVKNSVLKKRGRKIFYRDKGEHRNEIQ